MNKVAVVHDWLVSMRGGEKVLETVLNIFPGAEIFTLVYDPRKISEKIKSSKIHTSYIQQLPFSKKYYRQYLLFHPSAIESLDLRGYDIVISLSHCAAKGVIPSPGSRNISYIFTPMRYAYDMFREYFSYDKFNTAKKIFFGMIFNYLRTWDYISTKRIDKLLTISEFVNQRILRYYGEEAEVIYPPVDTEFFNPGNKAREDFYLIVSALVPYKRIEHAIDVFNRNRKNLVIIGTGPDLKKLKKTAGSNIRFLGYVQDEEVRDYYRRTRCFIFPGKEDFGITMAEALACGTPVIALDAGGAREIIEHGKSGILFPEKGQSSLADAVNLLDEYKFRTDELRERATKFSEKVFKEKFINAVEETKK